MFLCNWQNFKVEVENLLSQIYENKKSSYCFPILSLIDSPLIHRKSSEIWINNNCSFNFSLGSILKTKRREKIRIGYYSEDFREHPVANLIIELFELHNKDQFELFGFYFGHQILLKCISESHLLLINSLMWDLRATKI
jgi:predicted O-linked N-acetylglucosamine transferase (SPINDLY family)